MKLLPVRRWSVPLAVGSLIAILPLPAGAATTISIGSATRAGTVLTVSGQAVFGASPFVSLGTDPAGDQLGPGTDLLLGRDVTGLSVSTAPDGSLTLRWQLGQLPPTGRGTDVGYGAGFCISSADPEPNCWVVIFVDVAGVSVFNSFVQGWRCGDETCAVSSGEWIHTWETDRYDTGARTASASIPAADVGLTPGATLRTVASPNWQGAVFVTTPWWFLAFPGAYPTYDGTSIDATYRISAKEVDLAIGPSGQVPDQVAYETKAQVSETDGFAAELDVAGLTPGSYTVYARACFGEGNCGYASRAVTV